MYISRYICIHIYTIINNNSTTNNNHNDTADNNNDNANDTDTTTTTTTTTTTPTPTTTTTTTITATNHTHNNKAHHKSTSHESSWIFSGVFQWTLSGIFQRIFISRWYCPKDYRLSSGFLVELSNGLPVACSYGLLILWYLVCNI